MTIPVLAFVGHSGCGKTTLLSAIVPRLQALDLRIGVIKHTRHTPLETDMPGTDTRRFWDAGADSVVLVGNDRIVTTQRHHQEPNLDGVLRNITLCGDLDLIILEGYKRCGYPKLEVVRKAHDPGTLIGLQNRIGYITDVVGLGDDQGVARFELNAYAEISIFIVNYVKNYSEARWDAS